MKGALTIKVSHFVFLKKHSLIFNQTVGYFVGVPDVPSQSSKQFSIRA